MSMGKREYYSIRKWSFIHLTMAMCDLGFNFSFATERGDNLLSFNMKRSCIL